MSEKVDFSRLPGGEPAFVKVVDKILSVLAQANTFGSYTVEDIRQEGFMMALRAFPKWDGVRPLENFLCKDMKNKLLNLKRDVFQRNDVPCRACARNARCANAVGENEPCAAHTAWLKKASAKRSVVSPFDMSHVPEDKVRADSSVTEHIEHSEALHRLDVAFPAYMRSAWLRLLAGETLPEKERAEVERIAREILRGTV